MKVGIGLIDIKKQFIKYYLGWSTEDEIKKNLSLSKEEKKIFLNWAEENKMFPAAYQLLQRIDLMNDPEKKLDEYQEKFKEYINGRQTMIKNLSEIFTISKEQNIPAIYLKGISYEEYYPNKQYRKMNDIDIVIKNENDLWPFLSNAFTNGYEHVYMPTLRTNCLLSNNLDDSVIGLVKVNKENSPLYGTEFDLSGFTITDCTYIPAYELFRNTKVLTLENGTSIRLPSITNQILISIAELVTRPKIFIRDVLDSFLLMNLATRTDLERLEDLITKYFLRNELIRLVHAMKSLELDLSHQSSSQFNKFIDKFSTKHYFNNERDRIYKGHLIPYFLNVLPKNRAVKEILHFRRREKLANLLEVQGINVELISRINRIGNRFATPRAQFEKGHYVFFVYLGDHIKSEWNWIEKDEFQYVSTPQGLYWVSKEALEPEEIYDRAYEISTTLIERGNHVKKV
jgi:hypothetical protein